MGKNQSASNLTNIIKQDANGSIAFMSGSTMLMALSNTGQMSGSAPAMSAVTASYADNFLVKGNLTAQTLVVQTITSSVDFVTGSTRFGSIIDNTHQFTGSVSVSGSGRFSSQLNINTLLNILKTDNSTIGGQLSYDSNINQLYLWNSISSGYFSVYTNSTERLTITSGGNIGIGTNAPKLGLHIARGASSAPSTTGTSPNGTVAFQPNDGNNTIIMGAYGTSPYANWIQSQDITALGTKYPLVLQPNGGNVGIGTSNPGYRLTVVTDSTAALLVQATNATVGSPILDYYDNGRAQETVITSTDGTTTGTYIASYSNHPLLFGAYAGTSPTAKMAIATNGKVGIGTSSPDNSYQGLTIYGSDPSLRLKTSSASGWVWTEYVNSSGTNNFSMGVNQTSPYFGIKAGAGMDNVHFLMNSSGRIGINGNASTYSKLNVEGSTKINRSIYNWYQGYWTGNGTYWHMKTNMSAGLGGNIQYTMSLFKGYFYAYSSPPALEGTIVFHNWDGGFYNTGTTGNLFANVYRSSDNYVVLVTYSGSGEAGLTLDWHQAYGYPFVEAYVTAAGLHGSTTGKY